MATTSDRKRSKTKLVQAVISQAAYDRLDQRAREDTRSHASFIRHHLYKILGIKEE